MIQGIFVKVKSKILKLDIETYKNGTLGLKTAELKEKVS